MTEIIAKIGEISFKNVKVRKFLYEQFIEREYPYDEYRSVEDNYSFFLSPNITLKFSESLFDLLIQYSDELCKLQIENGSIISIAPFKSMKEIINEHKKKYPEKENLLDILKGKKIHSLRDQLQIIISSVAELEKVNGSASKEELYKRLDDYNIEKEEIDKLVNQLLKDEMIWSSKPNHYQFAMKPQRTRYT